MTEEKNTVEKSETRKAADPEIEPGEVVEEELVEGAKVRRKGIYLLPNALTTASLFSGFYAIVSAANGVFDNAAIAIFVSMILDGLDGRVARMTNTQSKFGEEYDSLADMVAFGVAARPGGVFLVPQRIGQSGLGGYVHLRGRRSIAVGPVQYPDRLRGQKILCGPAQSIGSCLCCGAGVVFPQFRAIVLADVADNYRCGRNRCADGQQYSLPQLQGSRSSRSGAFRGNTSGGAGVCGDRP